MKKMKVLGLALLVACVGTIGFAGCDNNSQPNDLLISNAKTEFSYGEDFALGENFKVELMFSSNKKMTLNNTIISKDTENGLIKTVDYTVDYSTFDSSIGGQTYTIRVLFNDHNQDSTNDDIIKLVYSDYDVTIGFLDTNKWESDMSITNNGWNYGEFDETSFVAPVAKYENDKVIYSIKAFEDTGFTNIEKTNLIQTLSNLNEGNYTLKATCPQSYKYATIEATVDFTVSPNLISDTIVPTTCDSMVYNGAPQQPALEEKDYYSIRFGEGLWENVGIYKIYLTPNLNWRWSDGTNIEKEIDFEIIQAENFWTNDDFSVKTTTNKNGPEYPGWYLGDPQNKYDVFNIPVAKFGDVRYMFKVTGQEDSQYAEITLEEMLTKDSQFYDIKAYVEGNENYTGLSLEIFGILIETH